MKAILFTILFMSFQFAFSQTKNEEELIRKARQTSNEAIAKQDVDGISKFWLDDYLVIRGSGLIEHGKETNKANWSRIFKETPQTYFERIPSEIIVSKNNAELAWESGEWKLQAELFVALEK